MLPRLHSLPSWSILSCLRCVTCPTNLPLPMLQPFDLLIRCLVWQSGFFLWPACPVRCACHGMHVCTCTCRFRYAPNRMISQPS
jgi:hypothetical protein